MKVSMLKLLLTGAAVLFTSDGFGAPVPCTDGYFDSTCLKPLTARGVPTQPVCQPGDGWATLSPAQWIGGKWQDPACAYQPPPSCPDGTVPTTQVWWTGSAWTGLVCAPE